MTSAKASLILVSCLGLPLRTARGAPLSATCASTGVMAAYRELTHQAALIGKDDRKPIIEVAEQLGITPAEVTQIRKSMGRVTCPGTKYKNGGVATAFLVGSSQKLMTVGHIFKDEKGRWREPLSKCYFENQDVPPKRSPLNIGTAGKGLVPGAVGLKTDDMDFAFANLKQAIPGVTPIRVETATDHELKQFERIKVVSADQVGVKNQDLTQPIAQECTINNTGYYRSTTIYTDCDLTEGGSGSAVLTRDSKGDLVIRAIMTGDAGANRDGESYNFGLGNYSQGIGFDAKVSKMIQDFISK